MNNFYWYIASKIAKGKGLKRGFSRPIIIIATSAVALGIGIMIIAISIVRGFQNQVRDKVVGFGAHVQITENSRGHSKESIPILYNDSIVNEIKKISSVKNVQSFGTKPGILETKKDIEGAIIKGVSKEFDWSFFKSKLVEGNTLVEDSGYHKNSVVISEYLADRLQLTVGKKVTLYFIQNQEDARPKTFRVVGVFNSGFSEFDKQFVFVPLDILAKSSRWGLEAQVRIDRTNSEFWTVEALGYGGSGPRKFSWSRSEWEGPGPHKISRNSSIEKLWLSVRDENFTYPDTAYFSIANENKHKVLLSDASKGSYHKYIGGYEVILEDYESVLNADDQLTFSLPYQLRSDTIVNRFPEIFQWLSTLDLNVIIIITLMVFVAVINMASALLIIILEKTNLIGLFKAFGSTTRKLSGVFLAVSARIFLLGLLIGNFFGIGFCILQKKFGIIKLDETNYYLDTVPIDTSWMRLTDIGGIFTDAFTYVKFLFDAQAWQNFDHLKRLFSILDWHIYALNFFVLFISMLCMFIPLFYVSRIQPVRAIKFD